MAPVLPLGLRFLIVHADDFGVSDEANRAVIDAFQKGVLTSCSLMPGGAAFEGAVRLARENPGLAVGIHATCVAGKAVLPPREIPALVDDLGNFASDPALAALKYFFSRKAARQLVRELDAQFERVRSAGIDLSHIDSHCHMHVNPAVLKPLLELGEKYRVRRMRVPEDDFFAAVPFMRRPFSKAGYALVFKLLCAGMKKNLKRAGFRFPKRVYGNIATGAMNREYVHALLERLPRGTSEIYFHPAALPDPSERNERKLQAARELGILLDPGIRSRIQALGIVPATYKDLDKP